MGVLGLPWIPARLLPGNPPAGSPLSITVPTDRLWHPLSLRADLQTSAVAGNRVLFLVIADNSGNIYGIGSSPVVQGASAGVTYGFAPASPNTSTATATFVLAFIPDLIMTSGEIIEILVSGMNAADQLENVELAYEWQHYA